MFRKKQEKTNIAKPTREQDELFHRMNQLSKMGGESYKMNPAAMDVDDGAAGASMQGQQAMMDPPVGLGVPPAPVSRNSRESEGKGSVRRVGSRRRINSKGGARGSRRRAAGQQDAGNNSDEEGSLHTNTTTASTPSQMSLEALDDVPELPTTPTHTKPPSVRGKKSGKGSSRRKPGSRRRIAGSSQPLSVDVQPIQQLGEEDLDAGGRRVSLVDVMAPDFGTGGVASAIHAVDQTPDDEKYW